jgi:hypothetical protein
MSCEACEQVQDSEKSAYYRWKTANIEVRACRKHLRKTSTRNL